MRRARPIPPTRPALPSRRHVLAGLSALALAPVLAACGSSGTDDTDAADGAGSPGSEGSDAADAAVFPVTVAHKYGETTVESAPQRVVCVGLTDQDSLLAVGVVPVATTYWYGDESLLGIYPWAEEAMGDAEPPTMLRDTDGIQIEQIAGLAPDLIVAQYSGITQDEYDKLSQLAPVIAPVGAYTDYGVPWDEAAIAIGTAVGKAAEMQVIVDDVRAQISAVAEENPQFAQQTAVLATPYEGLGLYGSNDVRVRMLTDFGFTLPPIITESDDSEFYVSVSPERTSELSDVDVVVWADLQADPQVAELFEATSTYAEGRWVDIDEGDGSYYIALSFLTPLAIPYLLERYVPQLVAAADGDPATEVPTVTS